MTKLLEEAVVQARELPAEDEDGAADALFAHIANQQEPLTPTLPQFTRPSPR